MKFLGILILAIFAVSFGRGDECNEDRAMQCVDNLLNALLDDSSEERLCRELRSATDCLKNTVDECFGDERDPELDEGLEELEKLLRENCPASSSSDGDDEDEEIEKCIEENEDYLFECIGVGVNQALALLAEMDNPDENALKCTMFGMMAGCFVERVEEKCGEKASKLAEKEFSTVPVEVHDACTAAGDLETLQFNFLESKKKK